MERTAGLWVALATALLDFIDGFDVQLKLGLPTHLVGVFDLAAGIGALILAYIISRPRTL